MLGKTTSLTNNVSKNKWEYSLSIQPQGTPEQNLIMERAFPAIIRKVRAIINAEGFEKKEKRQILDRSSTHIDTT